MFEHVYPNWDWYILWQSANPRCLWSGANRNVQPEDVPYRHLETFLRDLENQMSKKRRQTSIGQVEFINYRLTTAEKADFKKWFSSNQETLFDVVIKTIVSGYKISTSFSTEMDCFVSSITCQDESSPNYNRCMTSRSNDYWEAQALTIYKHLVLSDNGVWEFDTEQQNWG